MDRFGDHDFSTMSRAEVDEHIAGANHAVDLMVERGVLNSATPESPLRAATRSAFLAVIGSGVQLPVVPLKGKENSRAA